MTDAERQEAAAALQRLAEQVAGGADPPRFCGEDCAVEVEMAYAHGRDEERAAVVAYLRRLGGVLAYCAAIIEQGDHCAAAEVPR